MNRDPFRKKLLLLSIAILLLNQIGFGQLFTFNGKVLDGTTGIGIDHVEIVVSDIHNGTIYRQSTSNSKGDFTIEVPASQRVEMGIFHEKYKDIILSFDEITKLHAQNNPSINLQAEVNEAEYNLIIRAMSFSDVKISSASLIIRNEASGEVIEKNMASAKGTECTVQLTHGQPYEITLRADGYFERKWSFVWDKKGLDREAVNWDFFKSKDVFTKTREADHLWEIQLWPNSLNAQFELRDVYFSPGESYILPEAVKVLDKLMLFLDRYSDVVFELQHHSNDWGDYQRDLLFSQWRAQVLLDYLAERGELPSDQLAARGLGHALLDKRCEGAIQCHRKYIDSGVLHDHAKTTLKVIAYNHRRTETQQGGYYDPNKAATQIAKGDKPIEAPAVSDKNVDYSSKAGSEGQIIHKLKENWTSTTGRQLEDKFTGYAVQILITKELLPASHPIWNVQGVWVDRKEGNGHAYLVGNFSVKEDGYVRAKSMRKQYEDAFVVSYLNGERLY